MKVLGIGEVVLDKVSLLNAYPQEGEKIQPQKTEYSIGGPVAAALTILSRLGADCTFIASVGEDEYAEKIETYLKKENIQFIMRKQKATKVNTVLVNSQTGSRTIIKDNVMHERIQNISKRMIRSNNLIIFDRHEPKAFTEVIKKKRKKTKIIIDPSTEVSNKTLEMIKSAEYPIIPIESLKKFRRYDDMMGKLNNLYKISKKNIIVTLGEKGSLIFDGKKIELLPAIDIDPIDTLGAGDVFRGAFGYGVLKKWNIKKSVDFANKVSALQCMKFGNGTAIPTKREIIKFEKQAKYKHIHLDQIKLS